ncbi:hypothetical protein RJ55_01291 [Drechmeria coniospora]|nr:hypothetical protein RJ55_01291 [Drechmeria coniospora]
MVFAVLLAVLALATRGWGAEQLTSPSAVQAFVQTLENTFTIDKTSRPYRESITHREASDWNYFFTCPNTQWGDRLVLKSISKTKIVYNEHVDSRILLNDGNQQSTIKAVDSVAIQVASSKGWKIGGSFELGAGGSSGNLAGKLAVSAEYSDVETESRTVTSSLEVDILCDPGNVCSLRTLTFFAEVEGLCSTEPFIKCDTAQIFCDDNYWKENSVDQWSDSWRTHCRPSQRRLKPCSVTFPIFDTDRKPLTRLRVVTEGPA